ESALPSQGQNGGGIAINRNDEVTACQEARPQLRAALWVPCAHAAPPERSHHRSVAGYGRTSRLRGEGRYAERRRAAVPVPFPECSIAAQGAHIAGSNS